MSTRHVVPLADLIAHHVPGVDLDAFGTRHAWLDVEAAEDETACPCGPAVELVPSEVGGRDGWMVVHASLDGRELREQAA